MVGYTLDWGNAILGRIRKCELFILDEAGPLEFEQGAGLMAGLDFVDTHRQIPCFVVVRPSLVETACKRWSWAVRLELKAEAGS